MKVGDALSPPAVVVRTSSNAMDISNPDPTPMVITTPAQLPPNLLYVQDPAGLRSRTILSWGSVLFRL